MADNPLIRLREQGQSVWIDFISRDLIESGELKRLIDEDGISGVTSNPTIFEKAITAGASYDDQIRELVRERTDDKRIFRILAGTDIRSACDLLRPVYDRTAGVDGYASIEVAPELAYDVTASISRAHELFDLVDRPNVLVKIPATALGVKAIEELIAEGRKINITLLFSLERYREVINAYMTGLERFSRAGGDLSQVFSVASFFVSRVDSLVDKQLEKLEKGSKDEETRAKIAALKGKAAVANAKLAYQIYREAFSSQRFMALSAKGARPQRLLWASTSTKNPDYDDILYIRELIGHDTINTMTPESIDLFRDHGEVARTLTEGIEEAENIIRELASVGIDLAAVTAALESDGVEAFQQSFDSLIDHVHEKDETIRSEMEGAA